MKKVLLVIGMFILSLFLMFSLFSISGLYTIGDVPTKIVIIRYLITSLVCTIFLLLLKIFIDKNRNNKYLLLSGFMIIPFILYFLFVILINILPNNLSASNYGAIGLLLVGIFGILSIPCLILSILSFKKSNDKKTKIISVIAIILWLLILIPLIIAIIAGYIM